MQALRRIVDELIFSFPVQLLLLQIKRNQFLIGYWIILWAFVNGWLGRGLGIPYLFLDPEYLNEVGYRSFFLTGFFVAGFTMAYHVISYVLDAYRFRFLALMPHPFLSFCINNSIIPLLFTVGYGYRIAQFQLNEGNHGGTVAWLLFGFGMGYVVMLAFFYLYFQTTDQDVFHRFVKNVDRKVKRNSLQRKNILERLKQAKKETEQVRSFLALPFLRIKRVKEGQPWDRESLTHVFDHFQFNAFIFQVLMLSAVIVLGTFREFAYFQLPAVASALLLLTILLLFSGAISYWLKGWATTAAILVLFGATIFLHRTPRKLHHLAFGLDYTLPASYTPASLAVPPENIAEDRRVALEILEKWRAKFPPNQSPKLVIVCMSGGGLRSSLWSLRSLQFLDSLTQGQLMRQTVLMTGSSGGLVGGAYFRELYYRTQRQGTTAQLHADQRYARQIARDKLNPTVFAWVVNDLFFRFQTFEIGGQRYNKDRGYALEQQILADTEGLLDKPIAAYAELEKQALMPMLFIAPTVVNDGRRLYISPLSVSYMLDNCLDPLAVGRQGVDFQRFFKDQRADSLRFATALRMNATFPYITPNVLLPTKPVMEVADAGLTDNFGISDAVQFVWSFSEWIQANTSGVVLVSIRDMPRNGQPKSYRYETFLEYLVSPVGQLVDNLMNIQDVRNEQYLHLLRQAVPVPIEACYFTYRSVSKGGANDHASLSWRLTEREKQSVLNSIYLEEYQENAAHLRNLISQPELVNLPEAVPLLPE